MRKEYGIEVSAEDGTVWEAAVTSFQRTRNGGDPELEPSSVVDRLQARQLAVLDKLKAGLAALAALRWGEQ